MRIFVRILLAAVGALMLANAIFVATVTSFNVGWLMEGVAGAICTLFAAMWKYLTKIKAVNIIVLSVAALIVCGTVFVAVYGETDTAPPETEALIVLGAGIRGETVTRVLALRLDKAAEFYFDNCESNSGLVIVVSGGQGVGETITEAEAMFRYLVRKGVPAERIIKEDKSTSTYENLAFSKVILDENLDIEADSPHIAVVTNSFHVFRAEMIARYVGFESVSHLGAYTDVYMLTAYCLRELPAICAETIYQIIGANRN